jgi:hypothetical protein
MGKPSNGLMGQPDDSITAPVTREIKEEHDGYSDTNNIFYVVYNHKRIPVTLLDRHVYSCPGFGVPYAKNMVSHSPGNL